MSDFDLSLLSPPELKLWGRMGAVYGYDEHAALLIERVLVEAIERRRFARELGGAA